MFAKSRLWAAGLCLFLCGWALTQAQDKLPPPAPTPTPQAETPPPADAVAATVNGQPIPELAVFRGLLRVNPQYREQARKDVVNFLVDNAVVDQYLGQLQIKVEPKEVEESFAKLQAEAKKNNQDFAGMLKKLHLTEPELRRELTFALRWDKFVLQQGTDQVLRAMFDKNADMFNGSRVQAKHVLISTKGVQPDGAQAKVAALKKQIEADVGQAVAKLPADMDALAREKERIKLLDKTFADVAAKESSCPSKAQGGDLGSFPRVGAMVEPFARAAFALKPYQLSEPVTTEFGVHLILATDRKPGKDVKFEDVRPFVQEVYAERLREAILTNYKTKSKIVISEPVKSK